MSAETVDGSLDGVDPAGPADEPAGASARPEVPDRRDAPDEWVRAALEAVLMVTDEPVAARDLAQAVGVPQGRVERLLVDLAADYRGGGGFGAVRRGFELREVAGGWRIYSDPEFSDVVERFVREGQTQKLTKAALETLAIVAYRQPVSRGRISAIRGVAVDSVVRTLVARGLIDEVGQDPESGALLFGTTPLFLERMGLTSLDELEALAPHLPGDEELAEIEAEIAPGGNDR
jgi:segregation and condensation protein B